MPTTEPIGAKTRYGTPKILGEPATRMRLRGALLSAHRKTRPAVDDEISADRADSEYEMHPSTILGVGYAPTASTALAATTAPRAALHAELLSAWHEKGAFYVGMTLGAGSVILACQPDDIRSFARFRRLVLSERGVEVLSDTQTAENHDARRARWQSEVRLALRRGAAA
jgi:hypothetical protein